MHNYQILPTSTLAPLQSDLSEHGLSLFGVQSWSEVDVLLHPLYSPQENMEFDCYRAQALLRGEAKPMLRLYSWQPFAVSIGAHQCMSDIDEHACRRLGITLVRRPTGGRALVHAEELTYSIAVPLTTVYAQRRTVHDIYHHVHVLLLKAIHLLGATDVSFEKIQPDFRQQYRSGHIAMPCFASSARYELVWNTRKLVGSAQRLYGTVVLQHGSLLLGKGHELLAEVLNLSSVDRVRIRALIRERSISLDVLCGRTISFEEASYAVLRAFGYPYTLP
ncbi:MAG: lipoate--protein ligase family protein [Bacteroidota bacterium]|nr:lipoate--protein ligase family protein [Candidatus Kapabacteria bacterium]MDW8219080.1 lipoate--protein ligase family protein [Bacteroidota bacterium]